MSQCIHHHKRKIFNTITGICLMGISYGFSPDQPLSGITTLKYTPKTNQEELVESFNFLTTNYSKYYLYPNLLYSKINQNTEKDTLTEYLKKLTYHAITSEFRLDTAAVAKLMDENFISVYPFKTQNKQQELDGMYRSITRMKEDGRVVDSIYLDEFKVQLLENTAITSYYTVVKSKVKGDPIPDTKWRWLDVWIKKNGQWWWAASQATPLTKP